MSITEEVTRAIETCGMTRYALAKESGVSQGELSRVVAGQRSMTLQTLDRLAPFIGVDIVVKRPLRARKSGRHGKHSSRDAKR